jgi:hypothetical protein
MEEVSVYSQLLLLLLMMSRLHQSLQRILQRAALFGYTEIVALLLVKSNVDVNAKDEVCDCACFLSSMFDEVHGYSQVH